MTLLINTYYTYQQYVSYLRFQTVSSAIPKLLNVTPRAFLRKLVFKVKPFKNFGYNNFSHWNGRFAELWSHDHVYNMIRDIIDWNDEVIFQNTFILRRLRLANFANIIKIATLFNKTIFKDRKKVKKIRNYGLKCNVYLYFMV